MGISFIGMLMMLLGGGDLLDLLPTEAYWRLKEVEPTTAQLVAELTPPAAAGDPALWIEKLADPSWEVRRQATEQLRAMGPRIVPQLRAAAQGGDAEVVARAEELLEEFTGSDKVQQVRRLMAIRTLGERQAREALPALRELAGAADPFVAEYARRAIARIEGQPYRRPQVDPAALEKDLWLLPADVAIVGQARRDVLPPVTLDDLLAQAGAAMPAGADVAEITDGAARMLVQAAETVGNVRLDAVTLATAEQTDHEHLFVILIARGRYDPDALAAGMAAAGAPRMERTTIEGVDVLRPDSEVAFLMPSPEQLVLVAGPRGDALPVEAMARAIRAGQGGLAGDAAMTQLVRSVDRSGFAWAAMRVLPGYTNEADAAFLTAFDTIAGSVRLTDAGGLSGRVVATGTDAQVVAASMREFRDLLDEARAQVEHVAETMPMLEPLLGLLESLEVRSDGAEATMTGELEQVQSLMLVPMGLLVRVF